MTVEACIPLNHRPECPGLQHRDAGLVQDHVGIRDFGRHVGFKFRG